MIVGCFAVFDPQVIFYGLSDFFCAAGHAGCCTAQLNEVLSDMCTVEHGVEGGNFVHLHR